MEITDHLAADEAPYVGMPVLYMDKRGAPWGLWHGIIRKVTKTRLVVCVPQWRSQWPGGKGWGTKDPLNLKTFTYRPAYNIYAELDDIAGHNRLFFPDARTRDDILDTFVALGS